MVDVLYRHVEGIKFEYLIYSWIIKQKKVISGSMKN
jgi:hypothetical protein